MKGFQFNRIKPGDHVVMQRHKGLAGGAEDAGIRTVARLTPTQIILEPEGPTDRYQRCVTGSGFVGRNIGGVAGRLWIDRIASPKDVASWEVRKRAVEDEQERARARISMASARRASLKGLRDDWHVTGVEGNYWNVEFTGLTEAQVRKLAKVKL